MARRLVFVLFLCICLIRRLDAVDKFVIYSPPKCGTHLITKAFNELLEVEGHRWLGALPVDAITRTERILDEGNFVVCHNWTLRELEAFVSKGYKIIFILRDPRDHLASVHHWSYCPNWGGPRHILKILDPDKRMEELILGHRGWCCYDFIRK